MVFTMILSASFGSWWIGRAYGFVVSQVDAEDLAECRPDRPRSDRYLRILQFRQ